MMPSYECPLFPSRAGMFPGQAASLEAAKFRTRRVACPRRPRRGHGRVPGAVATASRGHEPLLNRSYIHQSPLQQPTDSIACSQGPHDRHVCRHSLPGGWKPPPRVVVVMEDPPLARWACLLILLPDSRIPIPESRFPNPESRFPNPESRFPNPESRIPIPESRIPNPDSRFPVPESRFPNPESRCLFTGKVSVSLVMPVPLDCETPSRVAHISSMAMPTALPPPRQRAARPRLPPVRRSW